MTSEAERQADHYRQVRARLYGETPRKRVTRSKLEWWKDVCASSIVAPAKPLLRITAIREIDSNRVTWKSILRDVAEKAGSTPAEVCGMRRDPNIVMARHEATYRMTRELGMSMPQIGARLGNRDHTTILYGLRKYTAYLDALAVASSPSDVPYSSIRTSRKTNKPLQEAGEGRETHSLPASPESRRTTP